MFGITVSSAPATHRHLRTLVLVPLLVLAVLGLTVSPPDRPAARAATTAAGTGTGTSTGTSSLAAAFVHRINAERVGAGRPPLAVDGALVSGAAAWSRHMAATSVLAHNPRLAGIVRHWRYLGENVGVGYSFSSLADAFWASSEHRANILDRHYDYVGVAVVDVGGKLWVTEDFMGDGRAPSSTRARRATAGHAASARPARVTAARAARAPRAARATRGARSADSPFAALCRTHAWARFGVRHDRYGAVVWPTALSRCQAA